MSEDFLGKILFKEIFNTFVKLYGMDEKSADAIVAVTLGSYKVSQDISIDTLVSTSASVLFDEAYKQILKINGLDTGIALTATSLDILTYSVFVSSNYESFFFPFDFIECGQNPNSAKVNSITPAQSRYDKPLILGVHGHDLDKITDITFSQCTKNGTLQLINTSHATISCLPIVNDANETSVEITTNDQQITIGTVKFYSSTPSVTKIDAQDRIFVDQRSLFEIHGDNLFTTSITIEDCNQVNVISREKYLTVASCSGFSSSGIKKMTVLNNEQVIHEKSILISDTQKPTIFSADVTRINEKVSSKITIFGNDLVSSEGVSTISYDIYGCTEKTNITVEKTLFSFDCFPDNEADTVYIDFHEEDFVGGELIKTISLTVDKVVKEILPLKITTSSIPKAVSCFDYEYQLNVSGGVPPYTWFKGKNSSEQGSPASPINPEPKDSFYLSLTSNTAVISGKPEQNSWKIANRTITAIVEDSVGNQIFKEFPLNIINSGASCSCQCITVGGESSPGTGGPILL